MQHPTPEERERRKRDKEETRARVVDAARALFSREGFEKVTIRMIAEEAGVATGSVFITFTSKDELCDEIISEYIVALGARLASAAAATAGRPALERLTALAQEALDIPSERMTFIREAIAASWTRSEAADRKLRHAAAPAVEAFERVLAEAEAAGELSAKVDRRALGELLWLMMATAFRSALYDGVSLTQAKERLAKQMAVAMQGWRSPC